MMALTSKLGIHAMANS